MDRRLSFRSHRHLQLAFLPLPALLCDFRARHSCLLEVANPTGVGTRGLGRGSRRVIIVESQSPRSGHEKQLTVSRSCTFRHRDSHKIKLPGTRIFSPLAVAGLCVTIGRYWYLFKL